eukprot:TRINITY_DN655_c0_g2_i1.p4 TRINITY_DN655_c0_g2~~TRINITY_DN655_c0_g2_i1.p4  ORF type:complete len:117 (-),score=3.15 TRINITY_DN655_c0_g2_i1:477-827(-)
MPFKLLLRTKFIVTGCWSLFGADGLWDRWLLLLSPGSFSASNEIISSQKLPASPANNINVPKIIKTVGQCSEIPIINETLIRKKSQSIMDSTQKKTWQQQPQTTHETLNALMKFVI